MIQLKSAADKLGMNMKNQTTLKNLSGLKELQQGIQLTLLEWQNAPSPRETASPCINTQRLYI